MRNRLLVLSLTMLGLLGGCPAAPPPVSPEHATSMPGRNSRSIDQSGAFAFMVRVKITSIEVPVGTASGSEEIWSYLDEERTRAVHTATLGRNGIRVGVAPLASWPDLVKILTNMTGQKLSEQAMFAIPGQPFSVELKGGQGRRRFSPPTPIERSAARTTRPATTCWP